MNSFVTKIKAEIKDTEVKLIKATKQRREQLKEHFSGLCCQLAAHFQNRGDEAQSRAYNIKSEVYDDDDYD